MANVYIEDYNIMRISGYNIKFPARIRQYINFIEKDKIAVMIGSKKEDLEYEQKKIIGNVFIADFTGILWQFDKNTIVNIWEIDENTLGMYDGQADIWVDVNELKVTRTIWNPWGLDNPEKY
ncbi:hypothetical protein [Flagellimonas crocea]|uniref:hypothetical protein n=1 Tax=Flagellimonas crocea TaxID=3067311 RepID=UPI00296EBD00|nr:hypothetical protein [Muricauda sp. DH64]